MSAESIANVQGVPSFCSVEAETLIVQRIVQDTTHQGRHRLLAKDMSRSPLLSLGRL